MLEIQIGSMMRQTLGQLAPATVADLFALDELEDRPAAIRSQMKGFRERIARAIVDLPPGGELEQFVAQLVELEPWRVPTSLRQVFQEVISRPQTTDAHRHAVLPLQEHVEGVEPRSFVVGSTGSPRVQKASAAPHRPVLDNRGSGRPTRGGGRATPAAARTATVRQSTVVARDPEREAWIRQMVMERLAGKSNGLLEAVLFAGVRHRAREAYPDLQPTDIRGVLKDMTQSNLVRFSAGRWFTAGR